MMDAWAVFLGSGLLAHAADAAFRSLALAFLAAVVLVWARRKDPALRLVIWRVVLYSALVMPLMVWLMPSLAVPVPLASSKQQEQPAIDVTFVQPATRAAGASAHPINIGAVTQFDIPQTPKREMPWKAIATAIYVVIAGFLLARLAMGWILSGGLKRGSRGIVDPGINATVLELLQRLGIRSVPELAESSAVAAPVTLGVQRPVILLPVTWAQWEPRKLRAVLAHELSHVARRDALTQSLAALHRSLFWFSPLGWWLERHLVQLSEEASDDFALNEISDRNYYAQILVDFLAAVVNARGRISWQGVSMAKGTKVERRVNRILSGGAGALRRLSTPAWVAVLLVAAPLACLMAAVRPVPAQKSVVVNSDGASTINSAPTAAGMGLTIAAIVQGEPAPPPPPMPAAAPKPAPVPAPAAMPKPPMPPKPPSTFQRFSEDDQDGESFVIVSGDSLTMSGGSDAARHAKSLKSKISGDFIWFQHDGKGYVIRDAATVRQAREFFAPQEALGKQQEALGRQQEELGRKMEELGKRMETVRVQVPDLTAELKQVEAQLAKLREGATMEQIGDVQSQLGELQSRLGDLQGKAGSQQGKIGAMQGELGEQQGRLGEQQGKLGEEQGRLAREAQHNVQKLLEDSIKSGKAQPE